MKLLAYSLLIGILYSCSNPNADVSDTVLQLTKNIDKYDSTMYVSSVLDISSDEKYLYFVDNSIKSVIVLNQDFSYHTKFGKFGKGPFEYLSCINVNVSGNNLYLSDYIGNSIYVYDKNTYEIQEKIEYPERMHIPPGEFCVDDDNNLFGLTVGNDSFYIARYNKNTKQQSFLGKKSNTSEKFQYHDIVCFNNKIIIGVPLYSNKITLFKKNDPDFYKHVEIPIAKNILVQWEKVMRENQGKTPFFLDIQADDTYIYLCYQNFADQHKMICKFSVDKDYNIILRENFHLKEKNGDNVFYIDNDRVITFAVAPMAIQVYED